MTTKFTPGPWVTAPYEGYGPRTTVRQGDEQTGMRIASTFETTSPKHIERNEANARLIAAAPDLHEVVEEVVEHFVGFFSDQGYDVDELDKKARAALAKAIGS